MTNQTKNAAESEISHKAREYITAAFRDHGRVPGALDVDLLYRCMQEVRVADFRVDLTMEETMQYGEGGHSVTFGRWLAITKHYRHSAALFCTDDHRIGSFRSSMMTCLYNELRREGRAPYTVNAMDLMELFIAVVESFADHVPPNVQNTVRVMLDDATLDANNLSVPVVAEALNKLRNFV